MNMNLTALTEQYRRYRDELLAEHPDLAEDGETLADTLEGISDLPDFIAQFIRNARRAEALAGGLAELIKDEQERKSRLQDRADKQRRIAQWLMESIEMGKIEQPDFVASIRNVPPKVEVTDEAALPDQYVRITRSPDRVAIKEALTSGKSVPGACLGNGNATLTIRSK